MSKIIISKEKALLVAKRYAAYTNFTMKDVASQFNIPTEKVSSCIYYCIFYGLLSKTEEKFIYEKISNNMSRHAETHTVSSKFERTLKNRTEYCNILKQLNLQTAILEQIQKVKKKINSIESELSFIDSLNIDDFIASEDEIDYIPPRNREEILKELETIKSAFEYFENENIVKVRISNLEKNANQIKKIYSL